MSSIETKKKEFKKELDKVLDKYNMNIGAKVVKDIIGVGPNGDILYGDVGKVVFGPKPSPNCKT